MEEQVQESVVEAPEAGAAVNTREGLDVSMPDVELASDVPNVQEAVVNEANKRPPNLITKEGDESQIDYGTDWENETRKFQSMYDKQKSDYESLKSQYEELAPMQDLRKVLDERPDVVELMRNKLEGKPVQETIQQQDDTDIVDESSFDPWEAYYKPESPSYKMRMTQEKALVDEAVGQHMSQLQGQVALQNLRNELSSNYNMQDEKDINEFIEFATTPRDQLPMDLLIDVYRKYYNKGSDNVSPNMEAVKATQSIPKTAGILQGGEPPQKNEQDSAWDRILQAGQAGRIP
tara:strand:+ start:4116 stop:4988 length:873 start_codon:yes stop_codon:yes gene_type:complete